MDLSIDVDFENLKLLTNDIVESFGPTSQGDWLHNIGIGYRVDQLIKMNNEAPHVQDKIYGAYRRLTDKDQMGNIYKF